MDARNVLTGCARCKCCKRNNECIRPLDQFFFVTVDYKGNLVLISDYVDYPTVEVDMTDQQITFHDDNVMDFNKPDTKLFYNGVHKITW